MDGSPASAGNARAGAIPTGAGSTSSTAEAPLSANDVQAIFLSGGQLPSIEDTDDVEPALSDQEHEHRLHKLRQVLYTLQTLSNLGRYQEFDEIVEKIADGIRDATWRKPLGQSGLLELSLDLIGDRSLSESSLTQLLRVIGNSCADTDDNRARVAALDGFARLIELLDLNPILPYVIPVLFNICTDYEPAQIAAYKAGLNLGLVKLLKSRRLAETSNQKWANVIYKLLRFVASQEVDDTLIDPDTVVVMLQLATDSEPRPNLDEFLNQTSIALTYLSNEMIQKAFLDTKDAIPLFLESFWRASVHYDTSTLDSEADEVPQLKTSRNIFTQTLADLSAHPSFQATFAIDGPEMKILRGWIDSSYIDLQSAACLALGNVARSDDACINFVQIQEIHRPLVRIISTPSVTDSQLLHATLSFLKNLAIPVANKPLLGQAALTEPYVLPRMWSEDAHDQVQFAAVSLTRLLVTSSPENVKRTCARLSAGSSKTQFQDLLKVFLRSKQEPTKVEAARIVISIIRAIHSTNATTRDQTLPTSDATGLSSQGSSTASASEEFYRIHDVIPQTLIYLGTHPKFPSLHSEAWFAMALMSRSAVGANIAAAALQSRELLQELIKTITGREVPADTSEESAVSGIEAPDKETDVFISGIEGLEPQQADPKLPEVAAKMDRENGLLLLAELLQRCPQNLTALPLDKLRDIVKDGSQKLLSDRAGT